MGKEGWEWMGSIGTVKCFDKGQSPGSHKVLQSNQKVLMNQPKQLGTLVLAKSQLSLEGGLKRCK